jgi:hypothetical protein
MDEDQHTEELPKAVTIGLTLAAIAGVVGVAVRLDRAYTRAYERWLTDVSPLTGPRERILRFRTAYRRRRLEAADIFELVHDLWDEIDIERAPRP